MKYTIISIILILILGCKSLTKSLIIGGAVGLTTGAGLGGGIYYKNRREAAILSGIAGLGAGLAASYYLYKDRAESLDSKIKEVKETEKKAYEKKLSEALSAMAGEDSIPSVIPNFVPSQVKGGKLIGGRTDWIISNKSYELTPEKQKLLEIKKKEKINE